MAIVGYQDNATTDVFTVLATEDLISGTVVYFTNNGWSNAGSEFSGVSSSSFDAAGGQQLMMLTVNSNISGGTIFSSADTSNSAFTWNTSSQIPGASNSYFSNIDLLHDASQSDMGSDQIYILQAGSSRPLDNISNFIFALDLGDPNANPAGFQEPTGYSSGAVPDGNVRVNGNPSNITFTNSALSDQINSDPNDATAIALDAGAGYHDGTFGLDLSSSNFLAWNATGGTKTDFLIFLSDSTNWGSLASLPTGSGLVNITGVPEPSRMALLCAGLGATLLRRRRSAAPITG